KKAEIFSEGDTPLKIFFLKAGSVKVFKSNSDGKELIINIYNANDFFGYEAILEGNVYQESAMAMHDSEIITIPKYDFTMLLQSHPDVSKGFVSILCKKVADAEKQLLNLAYNSVRQRTAEALLKTQQLKDNKEQMQISRDDLAKMVGTAAESVIRVLSDFRDEGLIDIEAGKIKITQPAKLEKVVRWNVAR
ncbi:MAG: transcriptional regulator, partial [Marivirga sp.]|nr:transcriptional regulator [Marivirga sp.]